MWFCLCCKGRLSICFFSHHTGASSQHTARDFCLKNQKKKEKEIWTQALSTAWHFKKLHTPATAPCFGLTAVNTCPKCRRQSRHPWASLLGGKKKSVGATSSAAEASRTTEERQARAPQEKGNTTAKKTKRCFKPERQKFNCAADHKLSVRTTWMYHVSGVLKTSVFKGELWTVEVIQCHQTRWWSNNKKKTLWKKVPD